MRSVIRLFLQFVILKKQILFILRPDPSVQKRTGRQQALITWSAES
jgi:hypothetical protein